MKARISANARHLRSEVDTSRPSSEPLRRVHLSYSGQVNDGQFIYTATEIAERYGLTGWINPAANGYTDLVVQGPASQVSQYERTMCDNDASGVLYSLADLEELKPITNESSFSRANDI